MKKIKQNNVPFNENLPVIEDVQNVKTRTSEKIAKRAIACLFSILGVFEIHTNKTAEQKNEARAFLMDFIERFDVRNDLTSNEIDIFEIENLSEQCKINMVWKYEAYWTLIWALGLVDELSYPSHTCDCEYAIQVVAQHKTFESFLSSTKLRSIEEILDEADLIYRYDWACVDARINGKVAPADLDSSVVLERHKGLNWLIGVDENDDWDNVCVNT